MLAKFDEYVVPKRNTIRERAQFYQHSQKAGESFEAFVRSLHELAANCRFEEKEGDMSQKLQLEQDNLTLENAVVSARHRELVKRQNESHVNFVTKGYNQK